MTADKHTLNKAKKWAGEILDLPRPQHSLNKAIAAAEVIRDLPDQWIDADRARELSWKYLAFAEDAEPEGEKGKARATLYRNFAGILEALLPAPAPRAEIRLGAWAMHPKHGKVLIVATKTYRDGGVLVAFPDERNATGAAYEWVPATSLSPLPDTHDDSEGQSEYAPGGVLPGRTSAEKEQMHRTLEKLNQQYTEPQPGEAWETDRYGQHMIRRENGWIGELGTYEDEYCPITPLRRLVPAQEPRVLTTVEDYENAAVGTVISYPALVDGDFEPDWIDTAVKYGDGHWYSTGEAGFDTSEYLSGTSRTVLWEPEA